jgi:excinuclease ABC subunit A
MEDKNIEIIGANLHNLKNVSLKIPRNKLVVITGLSGSGKSSLAFDTLYAEGQRRYVESLSSYARQFLTRIDKPEVEQINGIPPAIAIEQKVKTRNSRSTVGTSTEIYEYIKLLYARLGKTISPVSGEAVKKHTVSDVVDEISKFPKKSKLYVLSPIKMKEQYTIDDYLNLIQQQGFSRVYINDEIYKVTSVDDSLKAKVETLKIVIDRLKLEPSDEDFVTRFSDSIQTAFYESHGTCEILVETKIEKQLMPFSNKFEADGIEFEEPNLHMFSFNNPVGACPECKGTSYVFGVDEKLVIPDKTLSVFEKAVACWRGDKTSEWLNDLVLNADKVDFPIHRPYYKLTKEEKNMLWNGTKYFQGIYDFFKYLEKKIYKIQYRVMYSRYRGESICPECNGARLKKEATYVKVGGMSINQLVDMPIDELQGFFETLDFQEHEKEVAKRLLEEINSRIGFLIDVGLPYLTLNRLSSTLSGGESQRINLACNLGSGLIGSLYILDEPSIGLHSRDTGKLISILKKLRDLGNTVVVVEHDEDIIKVADEVIDLGPYAGELGGELVFQGTYEELIKKGTTLTSDYIVGRKAIEIPQYRKKTNSYFKVSHAIENNLKNIEIDVPLNALTVVTGVSGSGKSTLVRDILYKTINKYFDSYVTEKKVDSYECLSGDFSMLNGVEFVDQNPIGKSSRSNPVTYLKIYDPIRKLFASQQASKQYGFKPSHFSFITPGGRCEECQGEGSINIEMQFMADVTVVCDECKGKKFKEEVLSVKYKDKNIYDVLSMTINEAHAFFSQGTSTHEKSICRGLQHLIDVGLSYVQLGQSSSTLSGGESQRIKLAYFLSKDTKKGNSLFIFDEPTTGLHFYDIDVLLKAINKLLDNGNTVLIIEHNMDVIKCADHIIDLGPEGGEKGGNLVFQGTPEDLIKVEESYTAKALKEKF